MMRSILKIGYFVLIAVVILATLEVTARWFGLGTTVLYYNAAWGGMRPLPDQHVWRRNGAKVANVTVDENGFRSARAEEPGSLRVLVIGNSVTWGGMYIDDTAVFSETAADVLRASGQRVYAMNAGVNGTALVNHAEFFLHYQGRVDARVRGTPGEEPVSARCRSGGSSTPRHSGNPRHHADP